MFNKIYTAGIAAESSTALDAALDFVRRGLRIIPVSYRKKSPSHSGWPDLGLTEAELPQYFSEPSNIGLLLAEANCGLVDIDLDVAEAVANAKIFLPQTPMVLGRQRDLNSYYWYIPQPIPEHEKFVCGVMLIEIRSGRHQTIIPPSVRIQAWYCKDHKRRPALRVLACRFSFCIHAGTFQPSRSWSDFPRLTGFSMFELGIRQ